MPNFDEDIPYIYNETMKGLLLCDSFLVNGALNVICNDQILK